MNLYIEWLNKHEIPENIKNLLLENIFNEATKIGSVDFFTPELIMENNEQELWPDMFENKLLIIGCAINGDPWAISYRSGIVKMVILPFDDMPLRSSGIIPDKKIKTVANSVEEFIRLAEEDKLPIDYYDTKS